MDGKSLFVIISKSRSHSSCSHYSLAGNIRGIVAGQESRDSRYFVGSSQSFGGNFRHCYFHRFFRFVELEEKGIKDLNSIQTRFNVYRILTGAENFVFIIPGAIPFTLIPSEAKSSATVLTSASKLVFVIE